MKRLGTIGCLLVAFSTFAATNATLRLNLDDFEGAPVNTSANMVPVEIPNIDRTNVLYPLTITKKTTAGVCYWSNVISGTYLLQFLPRQSVSGTSYYIGVPQTNGLLSVHDLITNRVTLVTNTVTVYTGNLIVTNGGNATNVAWPVAGTNVFLTTNAYAVTIDVDTYTPTNLLAMAISNRVDSAVGTFSTLMATNVTFYGGPTTTLSNLVVNGTLTGNGFSAAYSAAAGNAGSGLTYYGDWFEGNYVYARTSLSAPTNATPPSDGVTIKAWMNLILTNGAVFKLPLYQ